MRLSIHRNSLLCSLSLLAAVSARSQPADDFFHGGAQFYISNNIANARELVDSGLKLYPDDMKLKKLDELLKQQQQQQNQQQQDQQNQQQQNQNQQGQNDQQKQDQQQQQKQNQQAQNQQNEQEKKDQTSQAKQNQNQAEKKEGKGEKDEKEQQATAATAKQMTPEEAKRLLDAQKGEEKLLTLQPPGNEKPRDADHPIKDW